jgi:hypothetical protein
LGEKLNRIKETDLLHGLMNNFMAYNELSAFEKAVDTTLLQQGKQ